MRGLVFSEFYDFIEQTYSPLVLEHVIEMAELPHDGAYSRVGNYSHHEMLSLLGALSTYSNRPVDDVTYTYGTFLFGRFLALFPEFFEDIKDSKLFLSQLEGHIHQEVRKLYPDTQPPNMDLTEAADESMQLHYRSHRPFAALAHGLINACIDHFGDDLAVERHDDPDHGGRKATFIFKTKWAVHG